MEEFMHPPKKYSLMIMFLIIGFAICITGCQIGEQLSLETYKTKTEYSEIDILTSTSNSINRPASTKMPNRTSTPIPVHTYTPLPTLLPEKAQEQVEVLMSGDGICFLPCWGNIIPGETSVEASVAYLKSFSQKVSIRQNVITAIFSSSKNPQRILNAYLIQDPNTSTINFIEAYRYHYYLNQLFNTYGPPAEIWLWIDHNTSVHPTKIMFEIAIFYPDKGFMAVYEGEGELRDIPKICSSNMIDSTPTLKIWPPEEDFTFEDIVRDSGLSMPEFEQFHKLEEVSSVTLDDFYTIFRDDINNEACIQVSVPW